MRFKRRRSDRPGSARSGLAAGLEVLESRQLLSRNVQGLFYAFTPSDLRVTNPITQKPVAYSVDHQLRNPDSSLYSVQGKVVSGKDRAGDEWTITVHGPGYVIVTDTSPNDGVLDDDIDTIQLVGTDINRTYVTGNVNGSFRIPTSGTIPFNRLIDTQGVRSVILNGFTLSQTVTPESGSPNNTTTGVYLTGGVRYLQFHDIEAPIDTSTDDVAVNVVIGDATSPLKVQPTIKLDHIFTTVFDSTSTTPPENVPVTTPTVQIIVNGQIHGLDIFSTTQAVVSASDQASFPVVGTTGRTSVQAIGVRKLAVEGAATNFTASRSAVPFQNGFSGLSSLGSATFGSTTDAVGLDVNGPIRSLKFRKGMGNPAGVYVSQNSAGQNLPATNYGTPAELVTYAGLGYVAGQVTATRINKLQIGPASVVTSTATNPDFIMLHRTGSISGVVKPGTAMVNSVIATSGSIGKVSVVGDQVNSEIKTGFHYGSFAAGLEGTRAASRIRSLKLNGSQLNSAVSATYRPNQHVYGSDGSIAGPGVITGRLKGRTYSTGNTTPLLNTGSGIYAAKRNGYLPPPEASATLLAGKLK